MAPHWAQPIVLQLLVAPQSRKTGRSFTEYRSDDVEQGAKSVNRRTCVICPAFIF